MLDRAELAGQYVDNGMDAHDAAHLAESDFAFEGARDAAVGLGWKVNRHSGLTPKAEGRLWRDGYRPVLLSRGALRRSILGVWVKPNTDAELAELDAS